MARDDFTRQLEDCIPHLRAYARSLVRSPDAANDLVQDTLLRAWTARARFTPGTNFKAWVFTILRNRFLDQQRRDRFYMGSLENVVHANLASGPSQESAVYFGEMARAYWQLSPRHREILMLIGAKGLGYEEAAQITGCPVGTVRSRLSRARTKLQTTLNSQRRGSAVGCRHPQPGADAFLRALASA